MTTAATAVLTGLSLLAFAGNSLLTRLALGAGHIDAASFTCVRLAAGAAVLALVVGGRTGSATALKGKDFFGPLSLFAYAAPFSFAYLRIGAAVGALVLFGSVQLVMIGWGVLRGERPTRRVQGGLVLAAFGLLLLTVPAVGRPDPLGVVLMAFAGVAWAVYSVRGKGAVDPLVVTARSFLLSVPLAVLLGLGFHSVATVTARGLCLSMLSGAVTSGLGYAIWYQALRGLSITQAAIVQLGVPILAALGAVVFLGEALSARLLLAGSAVLGGVFLAVSARVREVGTGVKGPAGR